MRIVMLFFEKMFKKGNSQDTATATISDNQTILEQIIHNKLFYITIALVFVGVMLAVCLNNQKIKSVNAIIQASKTLIAEGSYEEANQKLKEAEHIKKTKELEVVLALSNTLLKSEENFQSAVDYYQKNNYRFALDIFKKVSDKDTKNYDTANSYVEQIYKILTIETIDEAKKTYASGNYKLAYQNLLQAQLLSPSLEEIKQLMPIYENAKQLQEEQERLDAGKQAREEARSEMGKYEFGTGVVGIAIGETKTSSQVNGDYGFYRYVKDPQHDQFLWLWIGALNTGSRSVHVNPNDFRITSTGGYTANYDQASFNVKYLEATNVPPNSYSAGWLIFIVPKADNYVLHYNGLGGSVMKEIIL